MNTLIYNGRIVNPESGDDGVGYIIIEGDKVKELNTNGSIDEDKVQSIKEQYNIEKAVDAEGLVVAPGLIDMHVHFRDPGLTYKEDIKTGSLAAAHGGFTTVVAMPNTSPVVDCADTYDYIRCKADAIGLVNMIQAGSVTKGMKGKELSEYEYMSQCGMIAISEDGKSVMDSGVYRKAMKKAKNLDLIVLAHCEDINLVEGGIMNMGHAAKALGLQEISNAVENIIVARDIMLADETGARLHLCHCSTRESVGIISDAKAKGVNVTAEVCPHHFILCEDDIPGNNSMFKMNPPLRSALDRDALIEGLRNNIIEVISTDHAPHSMEEKSMPMEDAPFGIVGLETSLALSYTYLVEKKILTLKQLIEKMSVNPARILGIDKGDISEGKVADIVIFDVEDTYAIDPETFMSKGKNTPFAGMEVKGKVWYTILGGKFTYEVY